MSGTPDLNHHFMEALVQAEPNVRKYHAEVATAMPRRLYDEAVETIPSWEGYEPTPLRVLTGHARAAGVGSLSCKDEGHRFGLGSFKALGGAYAVRALAARHDGQLTVACATEGNHGRSVAWGAKQAGARCVIFLHERVSPGREAAIAKYGAEIRRVRGNYDDAVIACAEVAKKEGWTIVSDTSWPGYDDIPRVVMAGYGLMVQETLQQLRQAPTHVFLQAGVGGMAASVMAAFHYLHDGPAPTFIIVEPRNAACILASMRQGGQLTTIAGTLETVTAGLACGAPSPLALPVICSGAHAIIAIDDQDIIATMNLLARPTESDPAVVAGASGAAGLAALHVVMKHEDVREALGLGPESRVLVINTENDTDPDDYQALLATAS